MDFKQRNAISGVRVDAVGAGHAAGIGYLRAVSADTLAWKAPDSATEGTAVAIANGETKVLADGATATLFVVVTRTSATALSGTALLIISGTVSTADRLEEVDEAITMCLKAQSSGSGDQTITMVQLSELRAYRRELKAELARETMGSRVGMVDFTQ